MSFPNVIYGDYGDEKRAQSTKIGSLPLGTLMVLPDRREYVHFRARTGTAVVIGELQQTSTTMADTMYSLFLVLSATVAVGATSLSFTAGATTAVTTDQYADGFIVVAGSVGTGRGYIYKIKSNNSAATGGECTVTLYPEDPIQVALEGGTTLVGVRANPYNLVVQATADTVEGRYAGFSVSAVSAGFYGWLGTRGEVLGKNTGTALIAGESVLATTATVGGIRTSVGAGTASFKSLRGVGTAYDISLTGGYAVIDARI